MKNFFKNFRSYSFWVSLSGAVVILLNLLGKALGFEIENQVVEDCLMGIAGVLVMLGIISKPESDQTDLLDEINEENENEIKNESENESDVKDDEKCNKDDFSL